MVGLVYATDIALNFVPRLGKLTCKFSHRLTDHVLHCTVPVLVLNVTNVLGRMTSGVACLFVVPNARNRIRLNVCNTYSGVTVVVTVLLRTFHCTCRPFIFGRDHGGRGGLVCTIAVGCFIVFALLTFLMMIFCVSVFGLLINHAC